MLFIHTDRGITVTHADTDWLRDTAKLLWTELRPLSNRVHQRRSIAENGFPTARDPVPEFERLREFRHLRPDLDRIKTACLALRNGTRPLELGAEGHHASHARRMRKRNDERDISTQAVTQEVRLVARIRIQHRDDVLGECVDREGHTVEWRVTVAR